MINYNHIYQNPHSQNQLQTKNVSAKSITGKQIKLVQETTLYRTLLLSQDYNFATHYLNMVSGSSQGGWADSAQIYQANRLIKGLILKLGAQGYDANNPSELLIVNNRKEAHIYVYNLKSNNSALRRGKDHECPNTEEHE